MDVDPHAAQRYLPRRNPIKLIKILDNTRSGS